MITIGVDSHKRTHTVVAVDGNGRRLAEKTLATTPAGHLELVRWSRRWRERRWALEDCRHLTRRLEADLVRAGELVVRVPPKLMAGPRRSAREPGKSDPIDALSVTSAINVLEREIRTRTESLAPALLALAGCGPLMAAKLLGETGGVERFHSRAAFAAHNGTAPIPVWSGNIVRHRLNRGGNRQLNAALQRIAITQLRCPGPGRDYVAKRLACGDTKPEAIRALRRRMSDEVFRRLRTDEAARISSTASPALAVA